MPYAKAKDDPKIPALIDSMNASDIAFSVYDGDIKDGSSKCTDDEYSKAAKMFNGLKKPAIYVPGDNEWTDCHRTNNGGYNNLERLDYIRKTLFAKPDSEGQTTMPLEHQPAPYVENTRWEKGGVVFAGLNIPGSNNNKVNDDKICTNKSARDKAQCDADNAEWAARDAANIDWMKSTFAKAKAEKAAGVVLVIQADMGFDLPETEDKNERLDPAYDGYTNFINAMVAETQAFDGQVLLIHGDTHFFKVDRPLLDQAHQIQNFTRLETFGSPDIHWVKVSVDASTPNVFTIIPQTVKGN